MSVEEQIKQAFENFELDLRREKERPAPEPVYQPPPGAQFVYNLPPPVSFVQDIANMDIRLLTGNLVHITGPQYGQAQGTRGCEI